MTGGGRVLVAVWSLLWATGPVAVALATMIPLWYIVGWLIREHEGAATVWMQVILPRLRLAPPPGTRDHIDHDVEPTTPVGAGGQEQLATVIEFPTERREWQRRTA